MENYFSKALLQTTIDTHSVRRTDSRLLSSLKKLSDQNLNKHLKHYKVSWLLVAVYLLFKVKRLK